VVLGYINSSVYLVPMQSTVIVCGDGAEIKRPVGVLTPVITYQSPARQTAANTNKAPSLPCSCAISALVCSGLVSWTISTADMKRFETFGMKCQRQILCVSWRDDHITNADVTARTAVYKVLLIADYNRSPSIVSLSWPRLTTCRWRT